MRVAERLASTVLHGAERIIRTSPALNQALTRWWYTTVARLDTEALLFMNYGYAERDSSAARSGEDAIDLIHRYATQLYAHVVAPIDLRGRTVLEVGCGQGGGAAYIQIAHRPRSVTAVDVTSIAVALGARYHHGRGLRFACGNALALPFAPRTFDAVVNVESSHTYGGMASFAREVVRVLRPGGALLFTDYRHREQWPAVRALFTQAGLRVADERCITPEVLAALDQTDAAKAALIAQHAPWWLRRHFAQFAALRDTGTYEAFRTGLFEYRSFVLINGADS